MKTIRRTTLLCGLAAGLSIATHHPASAGRLFGTAPGLDSIVELDPHTGDVLNTLNAPPSGQLDGLAFDGQSLWFLGETPNTLYRLNPDTGDTLDTFALPAPDPDPENNDSGLRGGLAYLNGLIYITNWDFSVQDIEVFDPALGQVVGRLDIDGSNPEDTRRFGNSGLAAISGPDRLVVNTALSQEVHFIDPATGIITDTFHHNQFGVLGLAVVDGELYLGTDNIGTETDGLEAVHVYSRAGVEQRTFAVTDATGIYSLAGDHTAVPEPGTAAGLALGAGALLRRRRR